MLEDHQLPPGCDVPATRERVLRDVSMRSARWTPEALGELTRRLAGEGPGALAGLVTTELLAAWGETVEAFRDPRSAERRALAAPLAALCRLSPAGLDAALEAVLGGVREPAARRLLASAPPAGGTPSSPVLVVLASNLPALAVQPLLPALLLRRPVLLKSPSAEPLFAPAFVAALVRREPRLAPALAALTWRGGDAELETAVLAGVGSIVAYGEAATLADLERRSPAPVVGFGPRTSLAIVGADADAAAAGRALARDVALFDQRGCLSVQAVYVLGADERKAAARAGELAHALAGELARLAERWPPGPPDLDQLAALRQLVAEAEMLGLERPALDLAAGAVMVDPDPAFRPGPGLRAVRVHPLAAAAANEALASSLEPWTDRLQGAALAGADAEWLRPLLERLGVSRFAAPGELQSPDATWHNGGLHPFAALAR